MSIIESGYKKKVEEILKKYNSDQTNLLPILLEVQNEHPQNYVPEEISIQIAEELDIPLAKVSAAISFFSVLSDKPRGENIIRVCRSTACMISDSEDLLEFLKKTLGIKVGETTYDGLFTLEETECIGACDIAPAFKVNEKVYGNLDKEKIKEIILEHKEGKADKERKVHYAPYEYSPVRILSKNFGKYDPESIDEYIELGGFETLKETLKEDALDTIDKVSQSGLRGRGGAGYPTGKKLQQAKSVIGERKVLICNADEGEPGTFKDRQFIEHDPFKIIEGMVITASLVDANEGYIYVRHEYNHLHERLHKAVEQAREKGFLGKDILGSGVNFDIKVFSGAGAYICGEGGALIESMEGKVGYPRTKPPYTKQCGFEQCPTLVINVETLSSIASILDVGVEEYTKYGTEDSPGTKLISISGNINRPGAYEIPFGMTINEVIEDLAQGMKDGAKPKFIQIGGASGPLIPASSFDIRIDYNELWNNGFDLGSGAIVVCDEDVSVAEYLTTVYNFFEHESCGKCTPCREGSHYIAKMFRSYTQEAVTLADLVEAGKDESYMIKNIFDDYLAGKANYDDLLTAKGLALHMKDSAFCGLGRTSPTPILTAFKHFEDELKNK